MYFRKDFVYFTNYFEQFFGNFCVFEETFCALFFGNILFIS